MVGTALAEHLAEAGYRVSRLTRPGAQAQAGDVVWDPNSATADVKGMEGFDAVVNLNGASVAGKRWSRARKDVLRQSRLGPTRVLVDCMRRLEQKPKVFVSSSAVGLYGNRGDEVLTEESSIGTDFLAILARGWESEARRGKTAAGIRTVIARFGVIFSPEVGALAAMVRPFRMGLGGKLGSGKQWLPWVDIEDVVAILKMMIEEESLRGPVNVVAPNPVQNAEFTRILARVLKKWAIFPAPAFVLRAALGEMADGLLLASQRAVPERLTKAGYAFRFAEVEASLRKNLLGERG